MDEINLKTIQAATGILGHSAEIKQLLEMILAVAPTDISVLITGESGVGKELVARAIHLFSKRESKPMISVNCGAIPEGILESELFGHERGAFTGAVGKRKGYFETADGGTIFLDEIGEMPLATQVKLLRVLEEGEYIRVGGNEVNKVDVRMIAATNKNLEQAVDRGHFRQDLYYRLKTVQLYVHPLRDRREDIPDLIHLFASEFSKKNEFAFKKFSSEAITRLQQYYWPGNVRELRNMVESMMVLKKGNTIESLDVDERVNEIFQKDRQLPVHIQESTEKTERELIYGALLSMKNDISDIKNAIRMVLLNLDPNMQTLLPGKSLEPSPIQSPITGQGNRFEDGPSITNPSEIEKENIRLTLKRFEGNRRKTAAVLGFSERTLYRKIKEYGLT